MKCYILMGSPRREGNTAALITPFVEEMEKQGVTCEMDWLYDMDINGCVACRNCQKNFEETNCAIDDDMQEVFKKVDSSDIIIFATPVYSWYCTAPGAVKNLHLLLQVDIHQKKLCIFGMKA